MKRLKFVRAANMWCVWWWDTDPKLKKPKQHIQWFSTKEEAKKFIEE